EVTAAAPARRAWRYAAGSVTPDGRWIVCERELHVPYAVDDPVQAEPVNDVVAIPARPVTDAGGGGAVQHRLVGPGSAGGGDFVAAPTVSPDGSCLAWLRWDHPDMPWDAAEVWAGRLDLDGEAPSVVDARRVAGGRSGGAARGLDRAVAACLP